MFYNFLSFFSGTLQPNTVYKCKIAGFITAAPDAGRQILLAYDRYDGNLLGAGVDNADRTYEFFLPSNINDERILFTRRDNAGIYFAESYDRMSLGNETFTTNSGYDQALEIYERFKNKILLKPQKRYEITEILDDGKNLIYTPKYTTINNFSNITHTIKYENLLNYIPDEIYFYNSVYNGVYRISNKNKQIPYKVKGSVFDIHEYNSSRDIIQGVFQCTSGRTLYMPEKQTLINSDPFNDNSLIAAYNLTRDDGDIKSNNHLLELCNYPNTTNNRYILSSTNVSHGATQGTNLENPAGLNVAIVPIIITRAGYTTIMFTMYLGTWGGSNNLEVLLIPNLVQIYFNYFQIYLNTLTGTSWGNSSYTYESAYRGRKIYIALVLAPAYVKLYFDGTLAITRTVGLPTATPVNYLYITGNAYLSGFGNKYNGYGSIWNLMIFNKELSQFEINSLQENTSTNLFFPSSLKRNIKKITGAYIHKVAPMDYLPYNTLTLAGLPLRKNLKLYLPFENGNIGNVVALSSNNYVTTDGVSVYGHSVAFTPNGYLWRGSNASVVTSDCNIIDENNIDVYISFNIATMAACCLWKSGDNTYGVAIGINATNQVTLYCRNNSTLTSASINTGLVINTWYKFLWKNDTIYLYNEKGDLLESKLHGLTFNISFQQTTFINNGCPWRLQADFNTTQSGIISVGDWTTGTTLPAALQMHQTIVTKDRVYTISGYVGSANTTAVYTAPINSDGTLGTWTTGTALGTATREAMSVVTKNRVYFLGGATPGITSTVYTAPINSDGTLGTWTTGTALSTVLCASFCAVVKNRVYLIGGHTSDVINTIYYTTIAADGTLGSWTTDSYTLPNAVKYGEALVTKSKVYIIGGNNGSTNVNYVQSSNINSDGTLGPWKRDIDFPIALEYIRPVVVKNRVYIAYGTTLYSTIIKEDGQLDLNNWTSTTLPTNFGNATPIITNSRLHYIGNNSTTVYNTTFSGGYNDYLDKTYLTTTVSGCVGHESVGAAITGSPIAGSTGNSGYFTGSISDIVISTKNTAVKKTSNVEKFIEFNCNNKQLKTEYIKCDVDSPEVVAWVNIPTVFSSEDTVVKISMGENTSYGKTGSREAQYVWSNKFLGVYHTISGSSFIDSSGNCLDGTFYGIDSTNFTQHKSGYALDLNGTDEYIKIPYNVFAGKQKLSVYIAINPDNTNNGVRIIDISSNTEQDVDRQIQYTFNNNAIDINVYNNNTLVSTTTSQTINSSQWNSVLFTYKTTNTESLSKTFNPTTIVNTTSGISAFIGTNGSDVYIGKTAYGNTYYDGKIAEVFLFNEDVSRDLIKILDLSLNDNLGTYNLNNDIITFTIPKHTISSTLYDVPVMIRLSNSSGTTNVDLSPFFKKVQSQYFRFIGDSALEYKFGNYRDGICAFNLPRASWDTYRYGNTALQSAFKFNNYPLNITPSIDRQWFMGSYTLCFSFFCSAYPGTTIIFFGEDSSSGVLRITLMTPNYLEIDWYSSGSTFDSWRYHITYGWQDFVFIKDNGKNKYFLYSNLIVVEDGVDMTTNYTYSAIYSTSYNSNTYYIGGNTSNNLTGKFKNVKLFDRPLKSEEIYSFLNNKDNIDVINTGFITTGVKFDKRALLGDTISNVVVVDNSLENINTKYINGQPWWQQYNFNSKGVISSSFSSATAFPSSILKYSTVFTTNSRVYLIQGSAVYYSPINSDGSIGSWTLQYTSEFINLESSNAVVINDYVYIIPQNTSTYYAKINADGSIGTIQLHTIPARIVGNGGQAAFVFKNNLYCLSYENGSMVIIYTKINSDGSLGSSWVYENRSVQVALTATSFAITKNYVYLLGSYQNATTSSTIIWESVTDDRDIIVGFTKFGYSTASAGRDGATAVVARNKIYLLGGQSGSNVYNTIQEVEISPDGRINGNFATSSYTLATATAEASVIITNSRLYLLGGIFSSYNANAYIQYVTFYGGLNNYYALDRRYIRELNNDNNTKYLYKNALPHIHQFDFNGAQSGDITGWTTTTNFPINIEKHILFTFGGKVYTVGGYSSNSINNIYSATINTNGSIGTWNTETSFPINIQDACAVVTKSRVYIIGGYDTNTGVALNTVYYAELNITNNTIGNWTLDNNILPTALYTEGKVLLIEDRIYLIGIGTTSSITNDCYYAYINDAGIISNWYTNSINAPAAAIPNGLIVLKNYVYFIAGKTTTNKSTTIYRSYIKGNTELSSWETVSNLINGITGSNVITTTNSIYMLGGEETASINNVRKSTIDSLYNPGTFSEITTLPTTLKNFKSFVTCSGIYLVGGNNGSATVNSVYTTTFLGGYNDYSNYIYYNKNGNKTNYLNMLPYRNQHEFNTTQSGSLGTWTEITNAIPVALQETMSFVTKDKLYILGGYTGSVSVNTIYKADINSDGTLGTIASTGNTLPALRHGAHCITTGKRIYLLGGYNTSGGGVTRSCISTEIYNDGTIGTIWVEGTLLPVTLTHVPQNQMVQIENSLFFVYGTAIYAAPVDDDGFIGTWLQIYGFTFPETISEYACIFNIKNNIYILSPVSAITYVITVDPKNRVIKEYNNINKIKTLPTLSRGASYAVTNNTVYLFSGNTNISIYDLKNTTISVAGNTTLSLAQTKFKKGSIYFDGNGDYLSISYLTGIDLIGGDFTIEFWMYPTHSTNATGRRVLSSGGGTVGWNSTTGLHILLQIGPSSTFNLQYWNGSIGTSCSHTATISINQWYFISTSVSGNTAYISINGATESYTLSNLTRPSTNPTLVIGSINGEGGASSTAYTGYMEDIRITKGYARYNSNYSVPTVGNYTTYSNVILSIPFNGSNGSTTFVDNQGLILTAVGGAQISTAQSKFGGSSAYFNGTNAYLTAIASSNWQFGTSDFTIECWINFSVCTNGVQYSIAAVGDNAFSSNAGWFLSRHSTNVLRFMYSTTGTGNHQINDTAFIPTTGQWYHIAAVKCNTALMLFIDGVLKNTVIVSNPVYASTRNLSIGASSTGESLFNGYIDDFKITKFAKYISDFTPATSTICSDGLSSDSYYGAVQVFIPGTHSFTDKIYEASINKDTYTLGNWVNNTNLPLPVVYSSSNIVNNRIYLIGGAVSGSASRSIFYTTFSGGSNNYMDKFYYDSAIESSKNSYNICYSYTLDGSTYYIKNNSGTKAIATTNSGIHGFTTTSGNFFYNDFSKEWEILDCMDIYGAISKAVEYPNNRMTKTDLNNFTYSTPLTLVDNFEIAISMWSDGSVLPTVSSLNLNTDKSIWISDEYNLSDYGTTISGISYDYAMALPYTTWSGSVQIYCKLDNENNWTLCPDKTIPNITPGMSTSGRKALFKVVYSNSIINTNDLKEFPLEISIG